MSVKSFCYGVSEGSSVAGLPIRATYNMLEAMFPDNQESDWRELLIGLGDNDAKFAGHQFGCLLSTVKPKERLAALANLCRFAFTVKGRSKPGARPVEITVKHTGLVPPYRITKMVNAVVVPYDAPGSTEVVLDARVGDGLSEPQVEKLAQFCAKLTVI
jgi:hypothetical protein